MSARASLGRLRTITRTATMPTQFGGMGRLPNSVPSQNENHFKLVVGIRAHGRGCGSTRRPNVGTQCNEDGGHRATFECLEYMHHLANMLQRDKWLMNRPCEARGDTVCCLRLAIPSFDLRFVAGCGFGVGTGHLLANTSLSRQYSDTLSIERDVSKTTTVIRRYLEGLRRRGACERFRILPDAHAGYVPV